jgi:hypothetical protein
MGHQQESHSRKANGRTEYRLKTPGHSADDGAGPCPPTRLARSRIEEEDGWGLDAPLADEPDSEVDADEDIDIDIDADG